MTFKTRAKQAAERLLLRPPKPSLCPHALLIVEAGLYKSDHSTPIGLPDRWNNPASRDVCWGAPCCHARNRRKSQRQVSTACLNRTSQTEATMNIFYIIGVIVVVVFVAGFFGLHA
jgi:hypothetical protein